MTTIAGREAVIEPSGIHIGRFYIHDQHGYCLNANGKWHSGTGSFEEGYWPTEAAAREFIAEVAGREALNPKGNPMTDVAKCELCGEPMPPGEGISRKGEA